MNVSASIESSARRLFPDMSLEHALLSLLLERAQKNLIKYQTIARKYEGKYGTSFDNFRDNVLKSEPSSEVEQDYFDWELAVTGIADMEDEIVRLRGEAQVE
jgi:translation initiation factor 2 alpha subunit (eIF-2alpha)